MSDRDQQFVECLQERSKSVLQHRSSRIINSKRLSVLQTSAFYIKDLNSLHTKFKCPTNKLLEFLLEQLTELLDLDNTYMEIVLQSVKKMKEFQSQYINEDSKYKIIEISLQSNYKFQLYSSMINRNNFTSRTINSYVQSNRAKGKGMPKDRSCQNSFQKIQRERFQILLNSKLQHFNKTLPMKSPNKFDSSQRHNSQTIMNVQDQLKSTTAKFIYESNMIIKKEKPPQIDKLQPKQIFISNLSQIQPQFPHRNFNSMRIKPQRRITKIQRPPDLNQTKSIIITFTHDLQKLNSSLRQMYYT